MRTLIVDGRRCFVILEDGLRTSGGTVNLMTENDDGSFTNYRHVHSDPARAKLAYEQVGEDTLRRSRAFWVATDIAMIKTIQTALLADLTGLPVSPTRSGV